MLQTDKSIFCNCNQSLLRPFIHANHAALQKLEIKKLKTIICVLLRILQDQRAREHSTLTSWSVLNIKTRQV